MIDDEDYAYEQKRQRKLDAETSCNTCANLGRVSECSKGGLCECAVRDIGEVCDKGKSVPCPVCKGVCGVQVSINMDESGEPENATYASDWFDCDNCDATGVVNG